MTTDVNHRAGGAHRMPMTLQEKVRSLLVGQDDHDPMEGCQDGGPARSQRVREMEFRDWGCVYGIAFGLARVEEPCESIQSVTERALLAAQAVYAEWSGGFRYWTVPGGEGGA